jgi:hypothetical protein
MLLSLKVIKNSLYNSKKGALEKGELGKLILGLILFQEIFDF